MHKCRIGFYARKKDFPRILKMNTTLNLSCILSNSVRDDTCYRSCDRHFERITYFKYYFKRKINKAYKTGEELQHRYAKWKPFFCMCLCQEITYGFGILLTVLIQLLKNCLSDFISVLKTFFKRSVFQFFISKMRMKKCMLQHCNSDYSCLDLKATECMLQSMSLRQICEKNIV